MESNEIWKTIEGSNGRYEVSTYGQVRSNVKQIKILNQAIARGYKQCNVFIQIGKSETRRIHELVANAFLPKIEGTQIDHIDGNSLNNYLSNLQRITPRENVQKKLKGKTSGLPLGVTFKGKKDKLAPYCSTIKIKGKSIHLGYFTNAEDANKAYWNKVKEINTNLKLEDIGN